MGKIMGIATGYKKKKHTKASFIVEKLVNEIIKL